MITQYEIDTKLNKLNELGIFLKSRYKGIDESIDKIVSYMTPWYVFPDALLSPHIICMWGITGCGKTSLIQDIVEFLDMSSQFTTTINHWYMSRCNVSPENQMILLLDEFQNYRTKDENGCREDHTNNTDIWEFLSSGAISSMGFWDELIKFDEDDGSIVGDVPDMYNMLIRGKTKEEKLELLKIYGKKTRIVLPRTLVFICGNIDSAYPGSSDLDDESDADKYYEMSKKVTLQDIRRELDKMFFPEHISRLGSNHIIFPSFSTEAYKEIVKYKCNEVISSYEKLTGRSINIDDSVLEYLYNISVVPTQGARPLISTIRSFLGYYIPKAICAHAGYLNISVFDKHNIVINGEIIPLVDVAKRETVMDICEEDLIDCIVHEAGHVAIAIALGIPPYSVSIKGRFEAESNFVEERASSDQEVKDRICIILGGKAAQLMIFNDYNGCDNDMTKATDNACKVVRRRNHSGIFSRYETETTPMSLTEIGQHDPEVEALIKDSESRCMKLLTDNAECFNACVEMLRKYRKISSENMKVLVGKFSPIKNNVSRYEIFKKNFGEKTY